MKIPAQSYIAAFHILTITFIIRLHYGNPPLIMGYLLNVIPKNSDANDLIIVHCVNGYLY